MAHVFIVDDKTFPTHLMYSFAGTGAKEYGCDFLRQPEIRFQSTVERLLVGMISDISRIRIGDDVLFYLQQSKDHEGLFFGCFKVASKPFLASDDYLGDQLGKNLTFRVILSPSGVYPRGATERECLDSLNGINHPSEMCWSLIYRKLKGNRGCTMITDFEFSHILNRIKDNNRAILPDGHLSYNPDNNEIEVSNNGALSYSGQMSSLNIKDRLLFKYEDNKAYESHLQAYILQNLEAIHALKLRDLPIAWIGNEVSCGVGMQSIDVMFTQEDENAINFVVCELKDEQPQPYIEAQIKKYVDWIKEYLAPLFSKQVVINPTIVAPMPNDNSLRLFNTIRNKTSAVEKNIEVSPIRYIGFDCDNNIINFKEIINE